MEVRLYELARWVDGELVGDGSVPIRGFAGLARAGPEHLSFLRPGGDVEEARRSRAGAVVVAPTVRLPGRNLICVPDPEGAFNRLARAFGPKPPDLPPGIHPTALVDPAARVDPTAAVGPYAVVEPGAEIGARTQVGAFCYVGYRVHIGADCRLFPRVVVREDTWIGDRVVLEAGAVIGSDGFGWEPGAEGPRRVPQLGRVVVEDDVEIGANTTVDRARLDETRVGRGSKLDNLVHLGHNVVLGPGCMFAAQVGLAGTTEVGRGVEMGGQVGIAGHVRIGDGARIGAQSGVFRPVAPGDQVLGSPALPRKLRLRLFSLEPELPELFRRVKALEEKVRRLENPADR